MDITESNSDLFIDMFLLLVDWNFAYTESITEPDRSSQTEITVTAIRISLLFEVY